MDKTLNQTNKKNNESRNPFDEAVISWESPEYIQHEKGIFWYLIAIACALILCVYAIFTANWTLLVALIVLAAVYYRIHGYPPKNVKIKISRVGIKINSKEYPYQNIDSFWIIYNPPSTKTLNLKSNSRLLPDIAIQLGDQDPSEIREYLASQIREKEGREELFIDSLIRILKL